MDQISFLKENVLREEKLIFELVNISNLYQKASKKEMEFLEKSSSSLLNQIKIVHKGVDNMINEMNLVNTKNDLKIPVFNIPKFSKNYVRVSTSSGNTFIRKEDKKNYLEELKMLKNENIFGMPKKSFFSSIKRVNFGESKIEEQASINKPSSIILFSSRIFKSIAKPLSEKMGFLDKDLKQADMPYIISSYLSLVFLLTLFALIICFGIAGVLSISSSGLGILRNFLIALAVVIIFFVFMIYYPRIQVKNNSKKLENEMPFALAHLAAIASSRIAPSKIFVIMSNSPDYKLFAVQMKKVVNQMNIYGYDLTTALKNVSSLSSSRKFSEFLSGFTSIISSGGDLMLYLKEKSKDTLLDYKLSRERFSTSIGMYSDIYTALLIAAPLILMLILSFMSSLGSNVGNVSVSFLANIGIIAIIVLNILFIIFLNLTQPEI